jgi:hypothetical protein
VTPRCTHGSGRFVRAEAAERQLAAIRDFPARAARFDIPAEVADPLLAGMTDDELSAWATKFREWEREETAKAVAAARPDRRRGQTLVQNAPPTWGSPGRRNGIDQ